MPVDFLFVDGAHTHREAKKAMRRHVMLGKNAGKTFRRARRPHPSRGPQDCDNANVNGGQTKAPCRQDAEQRTVSASGFPIVLGGVLEDVYRSLHSPVDVSPAAKEIINECMVLAHRESLHQLTNYGA